MEDKFLDGLFSGIGKTQTSIITIKDEINITPKTFLSEEMSKKYGVLKMESVYENSKVIHNRIVFITPSKFYLYMERRGESDTYNKTIIYSANQIEEVKIFINSLKKIK